MTFFLRYFLFCFRVIFNVIQHKKLWWGRWAKNTCIRQRTPICASVCPSSKTLKIDVKLICMQVTKFIIHLRKQVIYACCSIITTRYKCFGMRVRGQRSVRELVYYSIEHNGEGKGQLGNWYSTLSCRHNESLGTMFVYYSTLCILWYYSRHNESLGTMYVTLHCTANWVVIY
jgi:hypothetical protein